MTIKEEMAIRRDEDNTADLERTTEDKESKSTAVATSSTRTKEQRGHEGSQQGLQL